MIDLIKNYATKKATLLKLEATEKSSLAMGNIVVIVLLALFGLFFISLLSIGMGFLLGEYIGNYSSGFLIVAGFYFVLLLIILLTKKPIQKAVANKIIQSMNK